VISMGFFPRLLAIAPPVVETFSAPPKTVSVPLFIWVNRGHGYVQNCALNLLGLEQRLNLNTRVSALDMEASEVFETLDGQDEANLNRLVSRGAYAELALDISSLKVPPGKTGLARVTVDAAIDGRPVRTHLRIAYRALELPKHEGWYGGDCHTHSSWSPDVWLIPLGERARYAKENGFGFLVMSDHSSGVTDWSGPDGYVAQCSQAQSLSGIPILPALEIQAQDGGHYLAYSLKPESRQYPVDDQYSCRDLVRAVLRHDYPRSYGLIAHPFAARSPWGDWSAAGFAGFELMNRRRTVERTTVEAWFGLLRTGLSHTMATGEFSVAVGGSDSHNLMQPGSRGFTWAYIPDYGGQDRRKVWEAIRRGRTSVSGAKDLAFFTVDGQTQGSVLKKRPAESLEFCFRYLPVTGRRCTQITLLGKDLRPVFEASRPTGNELRWTMPSSDRDAGDTFYVAAFTFKEGLRDVSEVWTNPVFVSSTT
jgi:hypothetical protein